jgi:hypothetical protein
MMRIPAAGAAAFILLVAALPAADAASPAPGHAPPASCAGGAAPAAATLEGRLTSVDFQAADALVCVKTAGATSAVLVTPGTLIQAGESSGGSYRAISDLKPGERVKIFTALTGGKVIASIVILQK